MKHQIDTDGYVLVFIPDHPRAYKSGSLKGYVAEHIVVAEKMLKRSLTDTEIVHHLDRDRQHNAHTNLLVLADNSQHSKLHGWMDKHFIVKKPEFYNRITDKFGNPSNVMKTKAKTNQCEICGAAIFEKYRYCSAECSSIGKRQADRPDSDQLGRDIISMPMVKVGEKYGVSDNAIRKWCRSMGIPCKLTEIK